MRTNKKLKLYSIFKNETNYSDFINHIRNPDQKACSFQIWDSLEIIIYRNWKIYKSQNSLRP